MSDVTKPIRRVLVVNKKTLFEKFADGSTFFPIKHLHRKGHGSMQWLNLAHREHKATLKRVVSFLKNKKVSFRVVTSPTQAQVHACDLVITVGGDGTFLRAARFTSKKPIVGINSSPQFSVGALCSIDAPQCEKKLEKIFQGKFRLNKFFRLCVFINGKKQKFQAVNDVLFANSIPAGTTRYWLEVDGKKELQKSSGIWFSTSLGSTAGIHAAGGRVVPKKHPSLQFLVREPFKKKGKSYQLKHAILSKNKKIVLMNQTVQAALYLDGIQAIYPLSYRDKITISLSSDPILVVSII